MFGRKKTEAERQAKLAEKAQKKARRKAKYGRASEAASIQAPITGAYHVQ